MDTHNDINVITDTRSSKINAHITYIQQTLRIYGARDLSGIYIVLYIYAYIYMWCYIVDESYLIHHVAIQVIRLY